MIERIMEVDRSLEVCIRRLQACEADHQQEIDTFRNALLEDSLDLEDLTWDELDLLMDMTLPQLREGLVACQRHLKSCGGEMTAAPDSAGIPASLPF